MQRELYIVYCGVVALCGWTLMHLMMMMMTPNDIVVFLILIFVV